MMKERKQKRLSILLALMLCFSGIVSSLDNIFNAFLPGIPINTGPIYIAYFVLLLWVVIDNGAIMSKDTILVLIGSVISIFCVFIFHPQNIEYMWTDIKDVLANPLFVLLFFAFIGYFVSRKLDDDKTFLIVFEQFSICTILLSLTRYLADLKLLSKEPEYMSFSYNLLLPTVFVALLCIQKFRWHRLIVALFGGVLILIAGCRGALIGVLISVLIYIFFYGEMKLNKKYAISAVLFIFASIVSFFYESILGFIDVTLSTFGINSRTVDLLLNFSFFNDSGRGDIIKNAVNGISLLGHGLWGDRVVLNGTYAHNLIIEILYDFGLILGGIILIVLARSVIKGLQYADEKMAIILCALISTGLVKLFLSSSFLNQEPAFYVLIGMSINSIKKYRKLTLVDRASTNRNKSL